MYKILIHVSILALIEILFYFNYVGPLESRIFKASFHSPTIPDNNFDPININQTVNLNFNRNNITNFYQKRSNLAESKRNNNNLKLYHQTIIYWVYLILFTLIITLLQLIYKYYFNKDSNTEYERQYDEIEMVRINSMASDSTSDNDNLNLLYRGKKKEKNKNNLYLILKKIGYYILLFACIFGFEYLFFKFIILKYQIISKQELEYIIIQTYLPIINKIFITDVINF